MNGQFPDLLTGSELALVAYVGKAGPVNPRWQQVHFNQAVARQFFTYEPGDELVLTLEKISPSGTVSLRDAKPVVYSEVSRNIKVEFHFGETDLAYPSDPDRPILVVVESSHLIYRYRSIMPGDSGYEPMHRLLLAGQSVGRGLRRRIVTLDEIEMYWPGAALRGRV